MHVKIIGIVLIIVISATIISKWDCTIGNKEINSISKSGATEVRSSVTFIMGTDRPNSNNFYKNATYYYHMHPKDKTDYVIHSCKTLKEILEYLSKPLENKYYGTINIVCHGNPWQGLSMKIADNLPRASLPNLQAALKSKMISPLCSKSVDHRSQINIISCGVAQHDELPKTLKAIFSCPDAANRPVFNTEKYYVNFTDKMDKKQAEFYFVASKYDRMDTKITSDKLKNKYKNMPINWEKAFRNENRIAGDEPYGHRFRMMVEWKIGFRDAKEIPVLRAEADLLNWLKTQQAAMTELQQMELKPEDFMWHSFRVTDQPNTFKVKGYSSVEGVMVDLKSNDISQKMAVLR